MTSTNSTSRYVKFSPPLIGQEEIDEVVDTLRSGWITTGPKTRQFESEFAAYVGAPAALALNSCTAALHTALVAAGVGPGDEVITSVMTFAATVNVIEHVGARPVLVDVCPDTLNLDPAQVAEHVGPRTKALIPVHFAGHPADMRSLRAIADEHNVMVLEDAAHAIPAAYQGVSIGASSNPVAFSFYATKNLTTGEGGMLTGEVEFIDRVKGISLHGMSREAWGRYERGGSWRYDISQPGFKYNMTDVQAAMGLWQLRKLKSFRRRREQIVASYQAALGDLATIELPSARQDVQHAWHLFVIRLNPSALRIDRDTFIGQLHERGVGTSVHFIPIHHHSYYRQKYGYEPNDFPVANAQFERILSLPLNPSMSEDDVNHVISATRGVAETYRRRRAA